MPSPLDQLLQNILTCIPEQAVCRIEDQTKRALANCLRQHYLKYPEAIDLQARGNVLPTTVSNHR